MCGIAGLISPRGAVNAGGSLYRSLERMTAALAHRGNQPQQFFRDDSGQCAFGHQRLSILDLSDRALQPMYSGDGRYVLVFNGEIYNYRSLRRELVRDYSITFSSSSDTEVLLYAYAVWGRECLERLSGQFAFAIWDTESQRFFAARDHMGIKPLYWFWGSDGEGGKVLAFASELPALLQVSCVPRRVNRKMLDHYLAFYSINAPHTLIEQVHALEPGHMLSVTGETVSVECYWALEESAQGREGVSFSDAARQVRVHLERAVTLRMQSDVPVGAFLSGGVDSAAIVALMSQHTSSPIKTFSLGFEHEGHYLDERRNAKVIVQRFSSDHCEFVIAGKDFHASFDSFIASLSQPSGDAVNTYLVSSLAAQSVCVALSGLGGDELFLGYRYFRDRVALKAWKNGVLGRHFLPHLAVLYHKSSYARSLAWRLGMGFLEHGAFKGASFYEQMRTLFSAAERRLLLGGGGTAALSDRLVDLFSKSRDEFTALSMAELLWYTPGMLLADADGMSMAHTLELRVPLLDRDLVSFVLSLPASYKVPGVFGENKALLAAAVSDLLPAGHARLAKRGFEMPIGFWLRDFFAREWRDVACASWLAKSYVAKLWYDMEQQPKNYLKVWTLLVLCRWCQLHGIEGLDEEKTDSLHSPWQGSRGSSTKPPLSH